MVAAGKQFEIARHTMRRAYIWHFSRWYVVPVAGLTSVFAGVALILGLSPWDAMLERSLTSRELGVIVAVGISAFIAGLILVRVLSKAKPLAVGLIALLMVFAAVALWTGAFARFGFETLGFLCAATFIVPFFLAVLVYSLRANRLAWFSDLSETERAIIDEAARRF